jgi:hypothetical protein
VHLQLPTDLEGIERTISVFSGGNECAVSQQMTLPNVPLVESSLVYWITTLWASLSEPRQLQLRGRLLPLARAADSLPGTLLTLLPWAGIDGVSRSELALHRRRLLETQRHWPDLAQSFGANLVCLDSMPSALPPQLYLNPQEEKLGGWEDFRRTLQRLIESIAVRITPETTLAENLDRLSIIICELFKNTHEHARSSWDMSAIDGSVRGLSSRYFSEEALERQLAQSPGPNDPLTLYLRDLLHSKYPRRRGVRAPKRPLGAIEITVFDAGPGLAQRWLRRDIREVSVEAEYEAILACFSKGRSSLSGGSRGYGLSKVLNLIRELRGFLRVRTTRLSLYRQYLTLPGFGYGELESGDFGATETLLDWRRVMSEKPSAGPNVRGTVISILVPDFAP